MIYDSICHSPIFSNRSRGCSRYVAHSKAALRQGMGRRAAIRGEAVGQGAYAAAAATVGSSSKAPLGMGRKSWKSISAANTIATMVQMLTTPWESR